MAAVHPSHYHYDPSMAAAVVASALYGLGFVATVVQWFRYRAWVWLVMVLAAASRCSLPHVVAGTAVLIHFSGGGRLYFPVPFYSKARE
jgi:hypothetical protein